MELRSLEENSVAGVTQVLRPAILFPATKCDKQSIRRHGNFCKATVTKAHPQTHTRDIDMYRCGWSVCLCIYSKTWKCSLLSPDDRRSETVVCTCTHTGTHTNTHTLTGAALLWHVQLWQLVFLRPLTLCDDSETGR